MHVLLTTSGIGNNNITVILRVSSNNSWVFAAVCMAYELDVAIENENIINELEKAHRYHVSFMQCFILNPLFGTDMSICVQADW